MARIRLQDVAERAGVSIKTVSNVVNGKGAITAHTRAKVEDALAQLQYRPNVAARHLRRGNSGMIAVARGKSRPRTKTMKMGSRPRNR